ncbi:MAG: GNAT family N-acetyltransferase [Cyclobacteriaceae bacterium]|jgi:RimJ/RimL family protein N-acetyltransferase
MQYELETTRTYLRQFTIDDAHDLYQLNLDPEVLKYTGDKPFGTVDDAKAFLSSYDQYNKYNVGRLAVVVKDTDQFIGWCGLKYDADQYDIGFRLFREYWNQGFATEAAGRCVEYGFNHLGLSEIIGRARKENKASIRVLEKIGMTFKKTFDFDGQEGVIYFATRLNL